MSTQLALTAGAAAVLLLTQSTPSPVVAVVPHAPTVGTRPAPGPRCPPEAMIRPVDALTPWIRTRSLATGWGPLPLPVACELLVIRARARALELDPMR